MVGNFPRTVLITGAGPVGLLAALLARQRGYDTHVLDRVTSGPKPQLVADLGASYHTGQVADSCEQPAIVIECTGVGTIVLDAADPSWLKRLVTRQVPLGSWATALEKRRDDVRVVLDVASTDGLL